MDLFILALMIVYVIFALIETKEKKDIFNPLFLFVMPLFFSIVLYIVFYKKLYTVSNQTLLLFFLGVTFFVVGYFWSNRIFLKKIKNIKLRDVDTDIKVNQIFIYFCLIIGLISLALTIQYTFKLGLITNELANSFWGNIRENYVDDNSIPFYVKYGKYFLLFSVCVFWYKFQIEKSIISKSKMYLLIILCILNSLLVLSRTDFLITILPLICIYSNCNLNLKINVRFLKKYKKILFIAFVAFTAIIAVGGLRTGIKVDFDIFKDPNFFIYLYFGYPLVAFDIWIVNQPFKGGGLMTLELLQKVFLRIGWIAKPSVNLAPRGEFNVYSFLFSPYVDFGTLGIVIYSLIIGFFCGWLYYKAKRKKGYWLIFYSIYTYAIFMAFFHWQFTIITYFYLIVFILIVSCVNICIWKNK